MSNFLTYICFLGAILAWLMVGFVMTHWPAILLSIFQERHNKMIREEERYAALERKIAIAEEGSRARQRGERWTPPPDWNDSID